MNSYPSNERQFNNPDSFAMAFDDAWKKISLLKSNIKLDQQEKIKLVFENIKEHPFIQTNLEQAQEIAIFRIKLLDLN